MKRLLILAFLIGLFGGFGSRQSAVGREADPPKTKSAEPYYTRTQDVVYGRVYGSALTLDVIKPTTPLNGAAVVWVVSGGWLSSHEAITPQSIDLIAGECLRRGYTVFAVVH